MFFCRLADADASLPHPGFHLRARAFTVHCPSDAPRIFAKPKPRPPSTCGGDRGESTLVQGLELIEFSGVPLEFPRPWELRQPLDPPCTSPATVTNVSGLLLADAPSWRVTD